MSEQTEMRIKMKTLVLAEKPSVGRDIGRVLHCTPQGNGFLEGKDYIVTWGLGHLVTLKDPEGYDKKYKEWKMEELPIVPKKTGNRSDPTDGKTVPDSEKTGTAAGCQRDRDCDGCRKRGRTGGALDLKRS